MNHQESSDPRAAGPRPPFREPEQEHPGQEHAMRNRPDFGEATYLGRGLLAGKKALITGADSGIGRAVALAFAREGADIGVAYLSEDEDARETSELVVNAGRRAALLREDLADPASADRIVAAFSAAFGQIDVLVNNAAYQGKAVERFEELDAERIRRTFAVNIEAMFHLVRAALPHMRPGSVIINVASVQAYQPSPQILDYAATKGSIVTFTKGLAHSLADRGIRVNAVAPGPVWTPIVAQSFARSKIREFGSDNPLGRPAQPAEIAPSFVFLASDESRFMNAEVLGITGGRLLA